MADFSEVFKLIDDLQIAAQRGAIAGGLDLIDATLIRVHERGEATDGSKLSGYSDKPYFTSLAAFVNKSGIPSDLVSENKKWVQLPEGYKSFRKFSGRQIKYKSLRYTGLMEKSYNLLPKAGNAGFQTGFIGDSQRVDENGVTAGQKMGFAESREGKAIINPNDAELDLVMRAILLEIDKVI